MVQAKVSMNQALAASLEAVSDAENAAKGGVGTTVKAHLSMGMSNMNQLGGMGSPLGIMGFLSGLLNPGAVDEYVSGINKRSRDMKSALSKAIEDYNKFLDVLPNKKR